MIHIGARACELAKQLYDKGFGGFQYPDIGLEDANSADYARLANASADVFDYMEIGDYVDWPQLEYDFAQMVKAHFDTPEEPVELVRAHEIKRDKDMPQTGRRIVVRIGATDEIEVYRMVDGVVLCNQEEE